MKRLLLPVLFLSCLVATAQTYPFVDAFESYTNFTTLGTQGGYLSDMSVYQTHGMGSSKGLISQISTFNTRDTTVSPLIGPLTATSRVSFYYRIVDQSLYPATGTVLGTNDKVEIFAGSQSLGLYQSIYSINQSNHVTSNAFKKVTIPVGNLAGQSGNLKIIVTKGSATDYFVDIDSLVVMDSTTTVTALTVSGSKTNVSCFGSCNGSITLNVSGGTQPYSYNWSSSLPATANQNNLCAGTYQVTVTDNSSSTASASFIITQPSALTLSINTLNATCYGGDNGCAIATVSGGVGNYAYNWSNGGPDTNQICGLMAGGYNLTATDANQCSVTTSFSVSEGTAINTVAQITNPTTQSSNDGSLLLSITGGTLPYGITINGGNPTPDTAYYNLAVGCYVVYVVDGLGCSAPADTFCLSAPNGITNENTKQTLVYPNPSVDVLNVRFDNEEPYELTLLDVAGQVISTVKVHTNNYVLSTKELTAGYYVLRLTSTQGIINRTFAVER
ncbi:MAG: T9SS type A sorting domain-containing protein [Chitinophagales bacterium]